MFSLTCKLRLCAGLSQLPSQTSRWAMARAPLSSEANTDSTRSRLSHAFQQFDVMSVGSGGSAAQRFRGLPSTIVNLGGENWIFDAGEGTLRQLVQKFGQSVTDTTRVFISKEIWLCPCCYPVVSFPPVLLPMCVCMYV